MSATAVDVGGGAAHAIDLSPSFHRRAHEGPRKEREPPRVTQQVADIFFHFVEAPLHLTAPPPARFWKGGTPRGLAWGGVLGRAIPLNEPVPGGAGVHLRPGGQASKS